MNEPVVYQALLRFMFWAVPVVFALLCYIAAPYGRHETKGWGPTLPSGWGWRLMEAPAALLMIVCAWGSAERSGLVAMVLFALWESHYLYRAFIYPHRRRDDGKRMPLVIVAMGFIFNVINVYLNGRWLFGFSEGYGPGWWLQVTTWVGLVCYIGGMWLNRRADGQLRALRRSGAAVYVLPQVGLFRWIDCPNYAGEMVQWVGWALLVGSGAGWAFAAWTAANLIPRARSHHRWYQQHFPDYPLERKALLPHIW